MDGGRESAILVYSGTQWVTRVDRMEVATGNRTMLRKVGTARESRFYAPLPAVRRTQQSFGLRYLALFGIFIRGGGIGVKSLQLRELGFGSIPSARSRPSVRGVHDLTQ